MQFFLVFDVDFDRFLMLLLLLLLLMNLWLDEPNLRDDDELFSVVVVNDDKLLPLLLRQSRGEGDVDRNTARGGLRRPEIAAPLFSLSMLLALAIMS